MTGICDGSGFEKPPGGKMGVMATDGPDGRVKMCKGTTVIKWEEGKGSVGCTEGALRSLKVNSAMG